MQLIKCERKNEKRKKMLNGQDSKDSKDSKDFYENGVYRLFS